MASATELGDLFPYPPRPAQRMLSSAVSRVVGSGGTLLVDAPTGSGKTVGILSPLLEHAMAEGHRVLYLVRTHSQAAQVLAEARAIAKHSGAEILAVTLEGRSGRCPLMDDWEEVAFASAEEYGKLCNDRKRATEKSLEQPGPTIPRLQPFGQIRAADLDGCPYYATLLSQGIFDPQRYVSQNVPSGTEFTLWTREQGYCPYETAKMLAKKAHVVVAPYIMFFHPSIRDALLGWMGTNLGSLDLIIDEAHNLPEYLRELASATMTEESVGRAMREVETRGNFQAVEGLGVREFLKHLRSTMDEVVQETTHREEEALLPEGHFEGYLLSGGVGTSARLGEALATLALWGDELRESRRREHRLPRSYVYNVASFLLRWLSVSPPAHLKVATREPRRGVMIYGLDATAGAKPSLSTHVTVHMSGTLAPLGEYRASLGLPSSTMDLAVPPVFPPENRRIFYSSEATTRYQDMAVEGAPAELRSQLVRTVKALPVRTAIFFPSFALMERMLGEGLRQELGRPISVEQRELSTSDLWNLVDSFKQQAKDAVLLGVCGGRIAEGLDFPDEALEAVVVVGIPYPRPTARREALRTFLESTIGEGWEHCYGAPARRAIVQALGRMIRSEKDRGLGIILDHRASRFLGALEGLEKLEGLEALARDFYH